MNQDEIDGLVASKLLGWTRLGDVVPGFKGEMWLTPDLEVQRLPEYCEDFNLAWLVVEKVVAEKVEEKFLSVLQEVLYEDTGAKYDPVYLMFHLTPNRICRTALRLWGIEVK